MIRPAKAGAPGYTDRGGAESPAPAVSLDDGTDIFLRPLRPGNIDVLNGGCEDVSAGSRSYRFHAPVRRLTASRLRYLTQVDQRNHIASCLHTGSGESAVGVAAANASLNTREGGFFGPGSSSRPAGRKSELSAASSCGSMSLCRTFRRNSVPGGDTSPEGR